MPKSKPLIVGGWVGYPKALMAARANHAYCTPTRRKVFIEPASENGQKRNADGA